MIDTRPTTDGRSAPIPMAPVSTQMKAIVQDIYGSPDKVLALKEIARPMVKDDEVLVRVHAASVHVGDLVGVTGEPYIARMAVGLRKPKNRIPGTDIAGTVEAVGKDVAELRPGDEVFGWCAGAFAEYACARQDQFLMKPANLTFERAAAVGVSASTALQLLRDQGKVHAGQKVLINGASGGLGTFAVQIAKAFGAEVTGVCSTKNIDMVRSIRSQTPEEHWRPTGNCSPTTDHPAVVGSALWEPSSRRPQCRCSSASNWARTSNFRTEPT